MTSSQLVVPIAEVVISLGFATTLVALFVGALAVALLAAPGWWTVPAFWLASVAASTGVYLVDANDPDYAWFLRALLALAVCGALAVGVSWRARPRASLRLTLPAALVGAFTPPVLLLGLFIAVCEYGAGTCPS